MPDIFKDIDDLAETFGFIYKSLEGAGARLEALGEKLANDKTIPMVAVATMLFRFKSIYEDMDKSSKRIYHVKERLSKGVLPERMKDEGLDMLRVPELARSFSHQTKMSASFLDKELGFKWLRDIGQGDIIQETVNASTLTSFVRNMILEEGVDPPEDVVAVNTYSEIGITKYTPKEGKK